MRMLVAFERCDSRLGGHMRRLMSWLAILGVVGAGCAAGDDLDADRESQVEMEVTAALKHDISPPLRDLAPFLPPKVRVEREFRHLPLAGREIDDPIAQTTEGPKASVTTGLSF